MDTGNFNDQIDLDTALEARFIMGERSAYNNILRECLFSLGYEDVKNVGWVIERECLINSLRSLCEDFGDNDWDTDLNLSDVVDKHLGRYLYEEYKK